MALVGKTQVPAKYLAAILAASAKYGVPPAFLAAQIDAESGFNPDAVSPDGAIGISQFLPGTAKSVGLDPHDPIASIHAQAKLMAHYKKEFGSWERALYAYHDGPGKVDNPGPAGRKYAQQILGKVGSIVAGVGEAASDVLPDNPFKQTEKLFGALRDPARWVRVGYWSLGAMLVLVGILVVVWTSGGKQLASKAVDAKTGG